MKVMSHEKFMLGALKNSRDNARTPMQWIDGVNGERIKFDIAKMTDDFSGHGGDDRAMVNELIDYLREDKLTSSFTVLEDSSISNKMACLAEKSRLDGGKPKDIK